MTSQNLLTEQDVRAMVRLVGEVATLDADQVHKRRALMQGLAKMVNADAWAWTISRPTEGDGRVMTMGMIHEGLSDQDYAKLISAETDPALPPPHGPSHRRIPKRQSRNAWPPANHG